MARFLIALVFVAFMACSVAGLDEEALQNRNKRLIITDLLIGKVCWHYQFIYLLRYIQYSRLVRIFMPCCIHCLFRFISVFVIVSQSHTAFISISISHCIRKQLHSLQYSLASAFQAVFIISIFILSSLEYYLHLRTVFISIFTSCHIHQHLHFISY